MAEREPIGLVRIGGRPRPLIPSVDRALRWLLASRNSDGLWGEVQEAPSDLEITFDVVETLALFGTDEFPDLLDVASAAMDRFGASGVKSKLALWMLLESTLPGYSGGGLKSYIHATHPGDIAAFTSTSLCRLHRAADKLASPPPWKDSLLEELSSRQLTEGGWPSRGGMELSLDATADVIYSSFHLSDVSDLPGVERGRRRLLEHIRPQESGDFSSSISVLTWARVLRALSSGQVSRHSDDVIDRGMRVLRSNQLDAGCWVRTPASTMPSMDSTALCVQAMILSGEAVYVSEREMRQMIQESQGAQQAVSSPIDLRVRMDAEVQKRVGRVIEDNRRLQIRLEELQAAKGNSSSMLGSLANESERLEEERIEFIEQRQRSTEVTQRTTLLAVVLGLGLSAMSIIASLLPYNEFLILGTAAVAAVSLVVFGYVYLRTRRNSRSPDTREGRSSVYRLADQYLRITNMLRSDDRREVADLLRQTELINAGRDTQRRFAEASSLRRELRLSKSVDYEALGLWLLSAWDLPRSDLSHLQYLIAQEDEN